MRTVQNPAADIDRANATAHQCDEDCRGCLPCYLATGQTICNGHHASGGACPHSRADEVICCPSCGVLPEADADEVCPCGRATLTLTEADAARVLFDLRAAREVHTSAH